MIDEKQVSDLKRQWFIGDAYSVSAAVPVAIAQVEMALDDINFAINEPRLKLVWTREKFVEVSGEGERITVAGPSGSKGSAFTYVISVWSLSRDQFSLSIRHETEAPSSGEKPFLDRPAASLYEVRNFMRQWMWSRLATYVKSLTLDR